MPSSAVKTCARSEEHTSELQSHDNLVCRLLLEKQKNKDLNKTTSDKMIHHETQRANRHTLRDIFRVRCLVSPSIPLRGHLSPYFFFFLISGPPRKSTLFPPPPPPH